MCPDSKLGIDAVKIGLLLSIGNMRKLTWNEDLATVAQVFYYVNYENVNYSVKNSTVDWKYLLYFS